MISQSRKYGRCMSKKETHRTVRATHLPDPSRQRHGANLFWVDAISSRFWRISCARPAPKSFKAQVVDECAHAGASVAGVALSNGLNSNLVHK